MQRPLPVSTSRSRSNQQREREVERGYASFALVQEDDSLDTLDLLENGSIGIDVFRRNSGLSHAIVRGSALPVSWHPAGER